MLQLVWRAALMVSLIVPAAAQAPSPAQMGITPATMPEVLQVLDNTRTWVKIGSVDPATHSFAAAGMGYVNVQDYGFKIGGADNAPAIATLMNAIPNTFSSQGVVYFPNVQSQQYSDYYFSDSFIISRSGEYRCSGDATNGNSLSTRFLFAAGVDGVVFESGYLTSDGGWAAGSISGCAIESLGLWYGNTSANSSTIANVVNGVAPAYVPTPAWHVGDGIAAIATWEPYNGQPAVPPGATISAVSGATLTLAPGFAVSATPSMDMTNWNSINGGGQVTLLQLPVSLKYAIQTTMGSNSVLVTAGPRLLKPGDILWSDAFPGGATVIGTGGALGNQTVTVHTIALSGVVNATKTYTSGAPGQMWTLPQGLVRRVGANSKNMYVAGWGVGLDMFCSNGSTPTTGCNNSTDQGSTYVVNYIGRLTRGDNTALGHSLDEVFGHSYIADTMEAGSLGSTYTNINSNSAEGGTSTFGIVGFCGSENYSVYVGGYIGGPSNHYCMDMTQPWGMPPVAALTGGPLMIAPEAAHPLDASVLNASSMEGSFIFYPSVTPAQGNTCVLMNSTPTQIFGFSATGCSQQNIWSIGWNTTTNAFDFYLWSDSPTPMSFTAGPSFLGGYTGYVGPNPFVDFNVGLLVNKVGGNVGDERLLCMSAVMPAETWHKRGDLCFNSAAAHGSPMGWVDLVDGANFIPLANVP